MKLEPTHLQRLKSLPEEVDEDGNTFSLVLQPDGEQKVYLTRSSKGFHPGQSICLGIIMVGEKNLLYHKFEDEKNLLQRTQSWSINYTIFQKVDMIIYETLKKVYMITKTRAEEFGEVIKFDGTEKKIYIPLVYWDIRNQLIDETEKRQRNLIGDSWYDKLKHVINSEWMKDIAVYLRTRRKDTIVFPQEADVFKAFKLTHFKHVKVVILGQDPYHDGSANGLAFGFKEDSQKKHSKSLDVIFREVESDVYGFTVNFDYSLRSWADQGVLLLNTVLTVEKGKPKSHALIGWQRFTKNVLHQLLIDPAPKVFITWGVDAIQVFNSVYDKLAIDGVTMCKVSQLTAKHPAADLYDRNVIGEIKPNYPHTFTGNKHFTQANKFLVENNRKPIKW